MAQQGECHCRHVTKLQEEMAALKGEVSHMKASFGARPFLSPVPEERSLFGQSDAQRKDADVPRGDVPRSASLPLKLGPLGSIGTHGRPPFDYRIAGQGEFQFSSKNGDQWKGKTERYFMSVVPATHALL